MSRCQFNADRGCHNWTPALIVNKPEQVFCQDCGVIGRVVVPGATVPPYNGE